MNAISLSMDINYRCMSLDASLHTWLAGLIQFSQIILGRFIQYVKFPGTSLWISKYFQIINGIQGRNLILSLQGIHIVILLSIQLCLSILQWTFPWKHLGFWLGKVTYCPSFKALAEWTFSLESASAFFFSFIHFQYASRSVWRTSTLVL